MATAEENLVKTLRILARIGSGAFGEVYSGMDRKTNRQIAIKFEPTTRFAKSMLKHESELLTELRGEHGIVQMHTFCTLSTLHALTMELLGANLEELRRRRPSKTFSVKTVITIASQMVDRLHCIHAHNILHRDLKPANMAIGLGDKDSTVHLLDFGVGIKYRTSPTSAHIPYIEGKKPTGNCLFMSLNTHFGAQSSRRDDLESLAYVLIYLLRGELPWSKIPDDDTMMTRVYQAKETTSSDELCKGLPSVFSEFLQYSRGMEFDEEPDYERLKNMFLHSYNDIYAFPHDDLFDWSIPSEKKEEKKEKKKAGFFARLFSRKN